jgi:hypothetical protein
LSGTTSGIIIAMVNWENTRKAFEDEMSKKLSDLPGHRNVFTDKRELRGIISHELPETSPEKTFRVLISILLSDKEVSVVEVKEKWLEPELKKEGEFIKSNNKKFADLKSSAKKWINQNLSEEQLQKKWKEHETWLPRRYTIYDDPDTPFQEIAADTLARYALFTNL